MERGKSDFVGDARASAGAKQQISDRDVVEMRGPVQCCRAVSLWRVHVDALLQQRPHRRGIFAAHGLDEAQVLIRGIRDCRCGNDEADRRKDAGSHDYSDRIFASTRPVLSPNLSITTPN